MNGNNYHPPSFKQKVRQQVLNTMRELTEILNLPSHQRTQYALYTQDRLERKLEYLLKPVETQTTEFKKMIDKNYMNYLLENNEVVDILIEKAGGSEVVEQKFLKLV